VLADITKEDMLNLTVVDHLWRRGDHFYKLAAQYYGDATYWWVIAQFNNRPTEAGLAFGDIILIPNPLDEVLTLFSSAQSGGAPPAGGY
jgi:nucleoid-associated protein YgaU